MDEATLVLIKPDAIQRGLVGAVLSRLEELRLDVIGAKAVRVSRELAEIHYHHLRDKPFYAQLVDYLQGTLHGTSYVLALVLWGDQAVARVRTLVGATHPEQADPTSIRGALGRMTTSGLMENIVHAASDSAEADREIRLWFTPQELLRDVGRVGPPRRRDSAGRGSHKGISPACGGGGALRAPEGGPPRPKEISPACGGGGALRAPEGGPPRPKGKG